ncbi:transaldolase family protein [Streptomyces subrutilus]|uniref:transaldolase family protein n=1 Tax=Streptomyces subrutilus TaxID=36818 RepID=UPI002E13A995|nr:hypothetical protein OG479_18840 [Streptomyces subrutilus]
MAARDLPQDGSVLRRLAAEGVSPWLDGIGRSALDAGEFDHLVEVAGVRGLLCGVESVREDLLRTGPRLPERLPGSAEALVEELLAADARRAGGALLRLLGPDGMVAVPVAPWHRSAAAQVEAARALAHRVGRPNVLVGLRATPEGLAAAVRCLGEGLGVYCGPVFGVTAYEAVLEAWLTGLDRAHRAGLDLGRIAFAAERRLPAPVAEAEAAARLLHACADLRYDDPRWPALVAAGARPHRLLWSGFDPATAAVAVPGLVGWGTGVVLSAEALGPVAREAVLRGETLGGAGGHLRRELARARGGPARAREARAAGRHERQAAARWSRARALAGVRIGSTATRPHAPLPPAAAAPAAPVPVAPDPAPATTAPYPVAAVAAALYRAPWPPPSPRRR